MESIPTNWRDCHCTPSGSVNDNGNNIEGTDPLVIDFNTQDFGLKLNSSAIGNGSALLPEVLPDNNLLYQYSKHLDYINRPNDVTLDIGAYEYCGILGCDLIFENSFE